MNFSICLATQPMLKALHKGKTDKNMLTSPLSLNLVLNMVASGSKGHTLQQLLCALGVKSIEELNLTSSQIMSLNVAAQDGGDREGYSSNPWDTPRSVMSIINGLWASSRCPLKTSFQKIARKYYNADTATVDFANEAEQIVKEVNSWVERGTKGLIKNILARKDLQPDTIIILANTLYFKAAWQLPFHEFHTRDENFHLLNGQIIKVPFICKRIERYFYGSFDGFELIKMNYGSNESKKFSMYVFLPDKRHGLTNFLEKFNPKPMLLLQYCDQLEEVLLLKVGLPKFKFSYQVKASDTMQELGINLPFKPAGDLTEMVDSTFYDNEVYISNILQMTSIEVNEQGTEAAAAGMVRMRGGGYEPPPAPSFVADHPFFFMIMEQVSGIVLFTGVVFNPLSN